LRTKALEDQAEMLLPPPMVHSADETQRRRFLFLPTVHSPFPRNHARLTQQRSLNPNGNWDYIKKKKNTEGRGRKKIRNRERKEKKQQADYEVSKLPGARR